MRHSIANYVFLFTFFSLTLSAEPLRELAAKRSFYIGSVAERGLELVDPYRSTFAREFNLMTVGVYQDITQPEEGDFRFATPEKMANFAEASDMKIRLHPLVWSNADYATGTEWMEKYAKNASKLSDILKTHIQTIVGHFEKKYPERIIAIDVVNEPLENLGKTLRKNIWWDIHPENPELYIRDAFLYAKEMNPHAKLFLNEIFTERNDEKFYAFLDLIQRLKALGTPIEGVGIQMHQFIPMASNQDVGLPGMGMALAVSPRKIKSRLKDLEKLGLEIHFTEMDIPLPNINYPNESMNRITEARQFHDQKKLYKGYVKACVESPVCKAVVVWGISDKDSWIPKFFPKFSRPLLFDDHFIPKPAYDGVSEALR